MTIDKERQEIALKISEAVLKAITEKGGPAKKPCNCLGAAGKVTVSPLDHEQLTARLAIIPPIAYVCCLNCGASVPYNLRILLGTRVITEILGGSRWGGE